MLGNLVFTLFRTDDDDVKNLLDFIKKNIEYEKIVIGLHQNASRDHVHVSLTNVELPKVADIRKYYNRKGLKDCVEGIKSNELKLTVYGEKDKKFDVKKCLAYPLKEYNNFKEIKYRQYINIDDQELESYRLYGNEIYQASVYKKDRETEYQEKQDNRQKLLFAYIQKRVEEEMIEDVYDDEYGCEVTQIKEDWKEIKLAYLQIYEWICIYNSDEEDKMCWRWSDIPNQVYSYMFTNPQFWSRIKIICFKEKIKL